MVFYRKYRPQTIDELDDEKVRETLTAVLANDVPHAFLFTGPKGLGKTSAARIVAKAVNCIVRQLTINNSQLTKKEKNKDKSTVNSQMSNVNNIEPCNKCEQCVSITNGTNLDVLEIDAASNRGIDEIRDLKEKINLAPVSARMKVYIIDEVHMLTTEAFNALLKTLEEPPAHAMFILCTTEEQKVPSTISSRCFHVSFTMAGRDELMRSFKRIIKNEKIDIDDSALSEIVELSDGGFRDGAKIFEEISLLANGKKITKELVDNKYQVSSIKYLVSSMLKVFEDGDTKKGLEIVSKIVKQGVDIKLFIQQLMNEFHQDLLFQIENKKFGKTNLNTNQIKFILELLQKAYLESKFAVLPQLPLEMVIIEFISLNRAKPYAELRESPDYKFGHENSASISDLRKQDGNIKKITAMYGSSAKQDSKVEKTDEQPKASVTLLHTSTNGEITKEWLDNFWNNLIGEMKSYNHTIAGVLRGCKIGKFDKQSLIIETGFKFHKERLSDVKTITELSKVAKMLTGREVKVSVELKK